MFLIDFETGLWSYQETIYTSGTARHGHVPRLLQVGKGEEEGKATKAEHSGAVGAGDELFSKAEADIQG